MADALQEEPHQNGVSKIDTSAATSHSTKQRQNSIDKDAQEMVIESLRSQIQDLFSQVSQLNNKLVKSYDRVSDLEDDLHVASANVRSSSVKISQLELERTQHLSALNTGLLVEKSHVTTELNRLMEKATEEAAQRGQAESARLAIEKDLDDLSATLFGQANSMVAEARYEKYLSERKVEDAEGALRVAEEAVQLMQTQMQALQAEKEEAEKKKLEMELVMGKGKWVATRNGSPPTTLRLLSTHSPYQEYLNFIAHLRVLHPTSPNPPAMATLLPLAFLHRLLTEDSEPTVRLDLAPSLNWLSRRSVLTAIHSGQLTIEPISTTTLFAESSAYPSTTTVAGMNSTHDNISCALCGVSIFPVASETLCSRSSTNPSQLPQNSWSGSFFKKSLSGSSSGTRPTSPTQIGRRASIGTYLNSQVFIFRMASLPTTSISSLPIPSLAKSSSQSNAPPILSAHTSTYNGSTPLSQSTTPPSNQPTTIYPLCMSGWCLQRLRTTCTLWAFVRAGIVDKVWEEELPPPPPPPMMSVERINSGEKPPIPPRKRGLWGIASAIGERAASWSADEKDKPKKITPATTTLATTITTTPASHKLPPPPPLHPSDPHVAPPPRRMPPPLPPVEKSEVSKPNPIPPPLPKRNEGRNHSANGHLPSSPPETIEITAEEAPQIPTAEAPAAVTTTTTPRASLEHSADPASPTKTPPRPPRPTHARTPSKLPLPDSRPSTPSPPSRTTSPAVVLAAGATATPPPLPRRAAARTRPVPSRSSTPVNVDAAAVAASTLSESSQIAEETEKTKESEEATAVVEEPKPASAEPGVVATEDECKDGEKKVEVDNTSQPDESTQISPASSGDFVDALTSTENLAELSVPVAEAGASTEEGFKADDDVDDKATIVNVPVSEPPTDEKEPNSTVDDDAEASKAAILSESITEEPSPVDGVNEKVLADADKEKEEEDTKQEEIERKAKEGYVGDGTWEEKTWKELVRLREDMFWARIGRARD